MHVESTAKKPTAARCHKRNIDNCDSWLETIEHHFKRPKTKEDRYDIFGKNVALKMRDISSHTQRLLAEKLINDALFMAEMGHLSVSHSVNGSVDNTSSVRFPAPLYCNTGNCPHFSGSQTTSCHETLSPTTMNSDSSTQSVGSYVANLSDA
jgi:hypothetical protein